MTIDTTEPPSTKRAILTHIADLERTLTFWKSINTGCGTCEAYTGRGCSRAGGIMPPPEVITEGCQEYVWDKIPF